MLRTTFFLVILSSLIAACTTSDNTREICAIDSLGMILNETEARLMQTDTGNIRKVILEVNKNLDFISEHYTDTFSRDLAFMLSDYAFTKKKMFKNFPSAYSKFMQDIAYSRLQLKTLHEDLSHHAVKPEDFPRFFITEQNAVFTLSNAVDNQVNIINGYMLKYDTLQVHVSALVDSLKTAKKLP